MFAFKLISFFWLNVLIYNCYYWIFLIKFFPISKATERKPTNNTVPLERDIKISPQDKTSIDPDYGTTWEQLELDSIIHDTYTVDWDNHPDYVYREYVTHIVECVILLSLFYTGRFLYFRYRDRVKNKLISWRKRIWQQLVIWFNGISKFVDPWVRPIIEKILTWLRNTIKQSLVRLRYIVKQVLIWLRYIVKQILIWLRYIVKQVLIWLRFIVKRILVWLGPHIKQILAWLRRIF